MESIQIAFGAGYNYKHQFNNFYLQSFIKFILKTFLVEDCTLPACQSNVICSPTTVQCDRVCVSSAGWGSDACPAELKIKKGECPTVDCGKLIYNEKLLKRNTNDQYIPLSLFG